MSVKAKQAHAGIDRAWAVPAVIRLAASRARAGGPSATARTGLPCPFSARPGLYACPRPAYPVVVLVKERKVAALDRKRDSIEPSLTGAEWSVVW